MFRSILTLPPDMEFTDPRWPGIVYCNGVANGTVAEPTTDGLQKRILLLRSGMEGYVPLRLIELFGP
jgi:hypothetical protein